MSKTALTLSVRERLILFGEIIHVGYGALFVFAAAALYPEKRNKAILWGALFILVLAALKEAFFDPYFEGQKWPWGVIDFAFYGLGVSIAFLVIGVRYSLG